MDRDEHDCSERGREQRERNAQRQRNAGHCQQVKSKTTLKRRFQTPHGDDKRNRCMPDVRQRARRQHPAWTPPPRVILPSATRYAATVHCWRRRVTPVVEIG